VLVPGGTEVRVSRRIGDDDERRRLADLAQALPAAADNGWIVRAAAAGATAESLSNEAERLSARWAEIEARRAAGRPPALLHRAPDAALAAIVDVAGPQLAGIVVDDPGTLAAIRAALPELAGRIERHTGPEAPFEAYDVEEQIEAALAPRVALPSGGVVAIAETAAVVAVDVDSGSAGGERAEETAVRVNIEAAEAIARQVRLRDLAGHIVIDFVPMRRRDNATRVLAALRRGFEDDDRRPQIAGFTRLGLVEMTRQRRGPSLGRRLTAACPVCAGDGRVESPETLAFAALRAVLAETRAAPGRAVAIAAAPAVIEALRGAASAALADVEARLGRTVTLRADAGMAAATFRVIPVETEKES
jgi:ribonuclease G